MKKTITQVIAVLLFIISWSKLDAQVPQAFNYQAVAKDASGKVIANQVISLRFSILQGGSTGVLVYQEIQKDTTNQFGLFSAQLGMGIPVTGLFSKVDWSAGACWLKVEMDTKGASDYADMGTSQLLSVPYAMYAAHSGNSTGSEVARTKIATNGNDGLDDVVSPGDPWLLGGNSSTVDGVNFIGTIDNVALNFKVNNLKAGRIDPSGTTFFGYQAGNSNLSNSNTGIGNKALFSNTGGNYNTAIGNKSLYSNSTGAFNTSIGYGALYSNSIGNDNTANGYGALYYNTLGNANTANGWGSLYYNTSGAYNTASGEGTLYHNSTGNYSTADGNGALYNNTTGSANTACGWGALYYNTTGIYNTAVSHALYSNTTGNYNTASGYGALNYNTVGFANTAIGSFSLYKNNTGAYNTANGFEALYSNTSGERNLANGDRALYSNTTGYDNTANSYAALYSNTTGIRNTANGVYTLYSNTTGCFNVSDGYGSLYSNNSGSGNTVIGADALYYNISGNDNTVVGFAAGKTSTTVNFNQCTFIGDRSSPSVARTNVTMLGYGISHTLNTGDNQVIIGNGKVKGWGFGAAPTTSKAFVVGSVSTNGNGAYLTVGGTWTNTSSRSLKDSITKVDGADVLKKISLLNVERWKYKETSEYHIGPFAEQFFELFNTGIDNKHISTVDPSGVALIGIQQLTKLNAEQQKLIEAQQKEIDALKARLDKLENK